jgi:hypothetical protein
MPLWEYRERDIDAPIAALGVVIAARPAGIAPLHSLRMRPSR